MKNITQITKYGAASFARAKGLRIRKRKAESHLAFTVTGSRSRHIVRVALEGKKALAECVLADSGAACKGFMHRGHCRHVGRALLFVCAAAAKG